MSAPLATPETLRKERLRLWPRRLRVTVRVEAAVQTGVPRELDSTLPAPRRRVANGNVTGTGDPLAEDGLGERIAIEGDPRATLVRLTSAGCDAFTVMAKAHEGWVNELLDGVDAEDAHHIGELLHRSPADTGAQPR